MNPFSPFPAPAAYSLSLSGLITNRSTQYEGKKGGKFLEPNQLNRLKMVDEGEILIFSGPQALTSFQRRVDRKWGKC